VKNISLTKEVQTKEDVSSPQQPKDNRTPKRKLRPLMYDIGTEILSRKDRREGKMVCYREDTPSEGEAIEFGSDRSSTAMEFDEIAFPSTADEAILNTCCLLLLKSLGHLVEPRLSKWTVIHTEFNAKFGKGSFTARTDGVLMTESGDLAQAIVEVKSRLRSAALASVMC